MRMEKFEGGLCEIHHVDPAEVCVIRLLTISHHVMVAVVYRPLF